MADPIIPALDVRNFAMGAKMRPASTAQSLSETSGSKGAQERAKKTAQDFEAMFVQQMLEPMFQGVKTDGLFGGGRGEEVYRSLLLQEYGKVVAQRGGLGVADSVHREILRMQEASR
jgi:Rod binding domain-containing protein